jgi:heme/copper-type cytochrome/quinol oxidase subunit 2
VLLRRDRRVRVLQLPGIKNAPASAANANITVEAHQFYWLFKYPSGRQSINVLTVPKT